MPEEAWRFMALGLILFFTGVLVGYNYRKRDDSTAERLSVIYDSIDDHLAPVTAKDTTEDEYVPVAASTLAWWIDTIEEILEDK